MSEYIPDELLTEILARLPVVSLLRFKSVCKSWCSLITSPSFITNHLNHSRTNPEKLLVRRFNYYENKPRYLLVRDDEKFEVEFSELEEPSCRQYGASYNYCIVGSCNGLLCLSSSCFGDNRIIVVWNPSIRQSIGLPLPSTPKYPHTSVFGFGAHPTTHEYKVIQVIYDSNTLLGFPTEVELYTQSTGSWRCISKAGPPYCISRESSDIFVNGAVHWVAVARKPGVMDVDDGLCYLIVSFDMGSEAFSEIMLPPALAHEEPILPPALALYKPLLLKSFGGPLAVLDERTCCIWVMKEYGVVESWTKLCSIDLPLASIRRTMRTMVLRKNGEVLFLKEDDGTLVSYDPRIETTSNTGIMVRLCLLTISNYMETLLSVKGGNGVF